MRHPLVLLGAAALLAAGLGSGLSACSPQSHPRELSVQGLPVRPLDAAVTGTRTEAGALVVELAGGTNAARELRIVPWPASIPVRLHGQLSGAVLRSATRFSPAGPAHLLELTRDGVTVLILGDNSRNLPPGLDGWSFRPGKPAASAGEGSAAARGPAGPPAATAPPAGRQWVELVLERNGHALASRAGVPVRIEIRGRPWQFLLIGASVPAPGVDSAAPAGPGPAGEQQALKVDWVAFP